ncbi:2-oxoacid:ferredoxin oxidoreductase subunit beta [Desulfohalobium retbaense]|uniref:Thiamine pyrophosphate protein domain protein TPP-binding protein n=1 Tax=Desulfohalobium retbaense (strain ATCC 49708 / DSM 5692 / JCM 16813 / HR100) TaxID=485915 RepID=C8X2P1_DESRD|nr:2-oxoacid:ferredoxin oxidoreductase subunit beta [Desulfohalobium retbaense]ACV68688.1 thiamine pyrophosphate protein domain protein TPP-binding protein [Desulfohalobium retbaense DSM 5692]
MSEVTQLIHHYLRHSKKFPHVFCPGCGHGIVLGSLIRSVHALSLSKDDVVLVAGIGCSGRMAVYVDFNTLHTTHGRALTFATGIKTANPKLKVIVVMGDGDALSIGGNHLIHAARRNVGITALILNNNIYGMTGGQSSPTSPDGCRTTTAPHGQLEAPFDTVDLLRGAGANFVARGTVMHAKMLDKLITTALDRPGFNVVEVLTPCHTQYGRKNEFKTAVDMYRDLKKRSISLDGYSNLSEEERPNRVPIGIFEQRDNRGLEEHYEQMRQQLQGGQQ